MKTTNITDVADVVEGPNGSIVILFKDRMTDDAINEALNPVLSRKPAFYEVMYVKYGCYTFWRAELLQDGSISHTQYNSRDQDFIHSAMSVFLRVDINKKRRDDEERRKEEIKARLESLQGKTLVTCSDDKIGRSGMVFYVAGYVHSNNHAKAIIVDAITGKFCESLTPCLTAISMEKAAELFSDERHYPI